MTGRLTYYLFWLSKALRMAISTATGFVYMKLWGVRTEGVVRCFGLPHIEKTPDSQIALGKGCILRSARYSNIAGINRPVMLAAKYGGKIVIGRGCGLSGAVIVSENSVVIGDRVQIGVNCTIVDTDFHPLSPAERAVPHSAGCSAPIQIGDDVWLGMDVIVLKGVSIGRGTVVSAGSVVMKSLPAGVLACGNPAQAVLSLEI